MDLVEWISGQGWVAVVVAVLVVYLFSMARMARDEPRETPTKPESLAGFDVEWCPACSIWVAAKSPWCGVKGCPRPHRSL